MSDSAEELVERLWRLSKKEQLRFFRLALEDSVVVDEIVRLEIHNRMLINAIALVPFGRRTDAREVAHFKASGPRSGSVSV
jgi:hypothetical protein